MNARVVELAQALAAADVGAAFGVPGSGLSWQLISALEHHDIGFAGTHHEAVGALMAGAYGRQSGRLGCSISIKGPGFANALPGILSNAYEQWPAVSVAEAYGPSSPAGRMHKRLDQRAIAAPVVKGYAMLGDAKDTVRCLAGLARAERPGPVHIDLVADGEGVMDFPAAAPRTSGAGASRRALDVLAKARRPLVIAGSLATRSAWGGRLATLRSPVLTTVAAKGACDERLPHAAGVYTGDGKELTPEAALLSQADVVLGLGLRNLEVLTPRHPAPGLVLLDVCGPDTAAGFSPDVHVPWAEESLFDDALELVGAMEWGGDLVAETTCAVRNKLLLEDWLPGRVFEALERMLPASRRLIVDTGSFCTVAEHLWRASSAREVIASANGRYMSTALPMALGAAMAEPWIPHVCAIGDGGMMYAADLKLAVERRLPLLVLLLSDGRYGSIAAAPSAEGLDMDAVTMARPSWYRIVEAMGCPAERVADDRYLRRAISGWLEAGGPCFIEASFCPQSYARMTAGIR